jgi:starch phosphorylase
MEGTTIPGEVSMRIRHFHVRPNIPKELAPLGEIARNLWFSWNWEAVQLFIRLNPVLWEQSYQNPVQMLGTLPQADLEAAAKDESFVANVERVYRSFQEYRTRTSWFQEAHAAEGGARVAYFSCEFGIDEGLPIYSGGLGVLSGDHLKSASDLGIPLVGVGLLYQKGYFRQVLSLDGWQKELYPDNDWYNMPVTMETAGDGRPLEITVNVGGEMVPCTCSTATSRGTPYVPARSHRPCTEATGTCGSGRRSCSASAERGR